MGSVATTDLDVMAADARAASRTLARMTPAEKNAVLERIADALVARADEIVSENQADLLAAREAGESGAMLDRLLLDEGRIGAMADGVRAIAALEDPVGAVDGGRRLYNGLQVTRKRIPLGVITVIYEGRPNVTSDAAALALKSGNAILLRGSRIAERSNRIIVDVIERAIRECEAPEAAVQLLPPDPDRSGLMRLVQMEGQIDLAIPRGGEGLKKFLGEHSRVPVIYAASGNCHVYVDASADLDMALAITMNAKVQRPGVCNAAETLLVHRDVAAEFIPRVTRALRAEGVELRMDEDALGLAGGPAEGVVAGGEDDFATEFLDLIIAVGIVDSVDEATEHITRFGSGHSEAIVTSSTAAANAFDQGLDSACIYINASTRFTDGGEFGMGAEVGNSTQKLHARGPVGLTELTTYKYVVVGEGQIRA